MSTRPFERVCVVGAGQMGSQIGLESAVHGYAVSIMDVAGTALDRAAAGHREELQSRVDAGQLTRQDMQAILSRIGLTTDLEQGTGDADLVVEAIVENLEAKRALFAQLDRSCPSHTILTTNSSSIRVSLIEDATTRKDKVLNMHFYGPIWRRPVVELMRGTATSDDTIDRAREYAASIGMTPLVVKKESTGFIFNRVWRAVKKECLRVVDAGVASHEDVDRAWMIAFGTPIGPFGQMDRVGLDVVRDIEMQYYRESGDESDLPPRFLLDMIESGQTGRKTGKGFYTYPDPVFADPRWLKGEGK